MPVKKYHINPNTGRPNQCTATVRGCKYAQGDLIPEHYDTKEDAQAAYEKKMTEKQGQTKSLKKPVKKGANVNKGNAKASGGISKVSTGSYWDNDNLTKDEIRIGSSVERLFDGDYHGSFVDEYTDAIKFDEGHWYHPTPDEPYHESDRHYTYYPSFEVADKEAFVQKTIVDAINNKHNSVNLPKGYKVTELSDEAIDELDKANFFSSSSYEAMVVGGYYGEEFHGFSLDNNVRKHATRIVSEDIYRQAQKEKE